jgi:hypothetical protein
VTTRSDGRIEIVALLCCAITASCALVNGPYTVSVAPDVHPRQAALDAVAATVRYLDDQTPQLAGPELHVAPRITKVWAVRAEDASGIDGCIPGGLDDRVVWITKGEGDYLNLADHRWSNQFSAASQIDGNPHRLDCEAPAPAGTVVIDDATGEILGVYPESPGHDHPTAGTK